MKLRGFFATFLLAFVALSQEGRAAGFSVLPEDQTPWEFPAPTKALYLIGDIHGDAQTLVQILSEISVLDPVTHQWIGEEGVQIALTGDLINRGRESRKCLELIRGLQSQAPGQVHMVLGNHEVFWLTQNFKRVTVEDLGGFADFHPTAFTERKDPLLKAHAFVDPKYEGLRTAMMGPGSFGEWIASQNAIIRIGDVLLAHGAIDPKWALDPEVTPAKVNATVRAWLNGYVHPERGFPSEETLWVLKKAGPISSKNFEPFQSLPPFSSDDLSAALSRFGAKHVGVGHIHTPNLNPLLKHPHFGEQVWMLDTGNSDAFMGRVSVVKVEFGPTRARSILLKRRPVDPRFVKRARESLRGEFEERRLKHGDPRRRISR